MTVWNLAEFPRDHPITDKIHHPSLISVKFNLMKDSLWSSYPINYQAMLIFLEHYKQMHNIWPRLSYIQSCSFHFCEKTNKRSPIKGNLTKKWNADPHYFGLLWKPHHFTTYTWYFLKDFTGEDGNVFKVWWFQILQHWPIFLLASYTSIFPNLQRHALDLRKLSFSIIRTCSYYQSLFILQFRDK